MGMRLLWTGKQMGMDFRYHSYLVSFMKITLMVQKKKRH